jgi:hypothetical protein
LFRILYRKDRGSLPEEEEEAEEEEEEEEEEEAEGGGGGGEEEARRRRRVFGRSPRISSDFVQIELHFSSIMFQERGPPSVFVAVFYHRSCVLVDSGWVSTYYIFLCTDF